MKSDNDCSFAPLLRAEPFPVYKATTLSRGPHSVNPIRLLHHFFFSNLIIMFFRASIALSLVLSLSGIAVHSAPLVR